MQLTTQTARLEALRHIPLFALRQFLQQALDRQEVEGAVLMHMARFNDVDSRQLRSKLHRLNRDDVTRLLAVTKEITGEEIKALFDEYRFGANPTFYVHIFDKSKLGRRALQGFRQHLEEALQEADGGDKGDHPRLRSVMLNELVSLPERPEIVEGCYRYQSRLDFVDEAENPVSRYQTMYGMFWINAAEGYAIVQARNAQVLKIVRTAIEKAVKVKLSPLVISKQLKNALPFLLRDSFKAGRLHDPDPGPGRFRWMTVSDDNPYAKGYQELEKRYPEVRSARYREVIDEDRETTLTIRSNRGALSLAGTLKASQMRRWTLDRLGQLISVLNDFRPDGPTYVQTKDLREIPELARFGGLQRDLVLQLISALLTVKQSPLMGFQPLDISPVEVAVGLGSWLRVQVPLENKADAVDGEGYLSCPVCDARVFSLHRQGESLVIECREHRRQRWSTEVPTCIEIEGEDDLLLDEPELAAIVELLPDQSFLEVIGSVINRHLPGYTFDAEMESFIIRGPHLIYYPDRSKLSDAQESSARTVVYVNQRIGQVRGGEVLGVRTEDSAADGSGSATTSRL
jgi:hypothetical protein